MSKNYLSCSSYSSVLSEIAVEKRLGMVGDRPASRIANTIVRLDEKSSGSAIFAVENSTGQSVSQPSLAHPRPGRAKKAVNLIKIRCHEFLAEFVRSVQRKGSLSCRLAGGEGGIR